MTVEALWCWATCAPGLEPEAAAELAGIGWRPEAPHEPLGLAAASVDPSPLREGRAAGHAGRDRTTGLRLAPGAVHGLVDAAALRRTVRAARTPEGAALTLAEADLDGPALAEVGDVLAGCDLARLPHAPFAVRASRRGEHPFRSPDLARVAGAAVIDAVRAARGVRLPVDLEAPTAVVRVELDGARLRVGLAADDAPWHRRAWRVRPHQAGLRPTVAAALVRMSGWGGDEALLDCCAGAGSIPIEAGLIALGRPARDDDGRLPALGLGDEEADTPPSEGSGGVAPGPPDDGAALPVRGLERFAGHVADARTNRAAAGLEGRVRLDRGDATRMDGVQRIDRLVTNPPYGLRAGSPRTVAPLYRGMLARAAERLADDGRAVVLTPQQGLLAEAAEAAGLRLAAVRDVVVGDLPVAAHVLTR